MKLRFCGIVILAELWNAVGEPKQAEFNRWAFGRDNFLIVDFVPLWNKLHGNAFFINEDRNEKECYAAIINLWSNA